MLKIALAVAIALGIGAACRYFEIPVPAPPKLFGALLIVAITLGYIGMDLILHDGARTAGPTEQPTQQSK